MRNRELFFLVVVGFALAFLLGAVLFRPVAPSSGREPFRPYDAPSPIASAAAPPVLAVIKAPTYDTSGEDRIALPIYEGEDE